MSKETVVDTKRREKIKDNILGYSFFSSSFNFIRYLFSNSSWNGHLLRFYRLLFVDTR